MRLIDADAFKEYICNAYEQVKHMYPDGGEWARQITEDFCKDIDEQPTIDPQKWIPVSKRLPERDEVVLVTYKTTDKIHLCKYLDDTSENAWWSYMDDCCA